MVKPATDGTKGEIIHVHSDSPIELQALFEGVKRTFGVKAEEQKFELAGIWQ